MAKAIADTKHHYSINLSSTSSSSPPPIVYGEISILGYNGYIPNVERNGRRNRSKFLLCKRPEPNGIKKSRHYIVKQPQATKAIKDKDLHSISYTFSRSQTIIVEYRQDENTDMFQIGRSSEDPIDFVVMDTLTVGSDQTSQSNHHQHHHSHNQSGRHNHNENSSNSYQLMNGQSNPMSRFHRIFDKAGGDMLHYDASQESRNRLQHYHRHQAAAQAAVLLSYPQPNISNLPPLMADIFRNQESSMHQHYNNQHGHSSGAQQHHQQPSSRGIPISNGNEQHEHCSSRHELMCKRSHATQSTISRFACRILVDRKPPYTARIYAAGFDSSKNIFLGEKATKWEQDDSIDGLTTNGVLLMHPKQGQFYEDSKGELKQQKASQTQLNEQGSISSNNLGDRSDSEQVCSSHELKIGEKSNISGSLLSNNNTNSSDQSRGNMSLENNNSISDKGQGTNDPTKVLTSKSSDSNNNDGSDLDNQKRKKSGYGGNGGVWREVSVDGGIYAIRESRSAAQKGTRFENETNILQDGTLIDLCGATLLWRSVDGFRASPTKKSLEEKIDMLNATRPQCPVGLNTLVIPRKPILPTNQNHRSGHKDHHHHSHHHHHTSKDSEKNSHQPYVYLKCGHVQGYHDWGTTDKSNQRTCPICLSVGTVAKLSMGLEPSFYVDSGPLTHVFNPCGHTASERTIRYWCSIKIPHGTHFFHSICPFCATPLATNEPAFIRLIFQDDLD